MKVYINLHHKVDTHQLLWLLLALLDIQFIQSLFWHCTLNAFDLPNYFNQKQYMYQLKQG